MLPGKLEQGGHLPVGDLVGRGHVDRDESVVRALPDKVHLAPPLPIIDLAATANEVEEDEVLQEPPFVRRKTEGDRVSKTGVDAVALPFVPVLNTHLVGEDRHLEEDPGLRREPEVLADSGNVEAELFGEPAIREQCTDIREESREERAEPADIPDGVGEDDISLDNAVVVRREEVAAEGWVRLEDDAGKSAGLKVPAEPVAQVVARGNEGERVVRWRVAGKPEVLCEVERVDDEREVPPAEQGRERGVKEGGRRTRYHETGPPAVVEGFQVSLPAGRVLNLVEDEVRVVAGIDLPAVGLEDALDRVVAINESGFVEVHEQDTPGLDAVVPDQVVDTLVEERGLAGAANSGEDDDLAGLQV